MVGNVAPRGVRVPRATYRLQLNVDTNFADAAALVPYLAPYSSPASSPGPRTSTYSPAKESSLRGVGARYRYERATCSATFRWPLHGPRTHDRRFAARSMKLHHFPTTPEV